MSNTTTLVRALQGKRGTGYIHEALPEGTPHASELLGASATSDTLPAAASVQLASVLPKDQSASDSCLGQSVAQAYRIACLVKGQDCPELSGLFPYALGRAAMGIEGQDVGMTYSGAITALERFGVAREAAWPFSLLRVNSRPSGAAYHDAYDRRGVRKIYEIHSGDSLTVKQAIARGVPVIGAWQVDAAFGQSQGPIVIDVITGEIIGSHAMVIEDYAGDGTFGILNHYGRGWRFNGRARFTQAQVERSLGFIIMDVG